MVNSCRDKYACTREDIPTTVHSRTLSKTSIASVSFVKNNVKASKVLVRKATGLRPCSVWGRRVSWLMRGYGIYNNHQDDIISKDEQGGPKIPLVSVPRRWMRR